MQDGISSIPEFSSDVCGSMVCSSRGFRKCHIGPDYCLREEVDLKIADNIFFHSLFPREAVIIFLEIWNLKKLLSLLRKTAVLKTATWAVLTLKKKKHSL